MADSGDVLSLYGVVVNNDTEGNHLLCGTLNQTFSPIVFGHNDPESVDMPVGSLLTPVQHNHVSVYSTNTYVTLIRIQSNAFEPQVLYNAFTSVTRRASDAFEPRSLGSILTTGRLDSFDRGLLKNILQGIRDYYEVGSVSPPVGLPAVYLMTGYRPVQMDFESWVSVGLPSTSNPSGQPITGITAFVIRRPTVT